MIYQDLQRARLAHYQAIKNQEQAARECADAEYNYDIAKGAVTAALRDAGEPVTLINQLVKADEEVAKAKRKFAVAEGVYKAACARTQATYQDWKQADAQYVREWQVSGEC